MLQFCETDKNFFDYSSFWKNSLTGAITSKLLAKSVRPDTAEDAFFVGLLHDIGILAIVQSMPKQYILVLNEMRRSGCDFYEAARSDHILD